MSQPQPGRRSNELDDLKKELGEKKIEKKMEAIKKIIAMLNVGKDVAPLFFPVMKCLEIDSIDMKKLVYLYIIHYSKDKPGDSIAVINLLVKDAKNKSNAIVRALAVRTFGCLRVPELCTYLVEPLGFALDDSDAYVRKNAAMCVPKVYEIDPDLIEQKGIIEKVRKMLETDKNPVVVSSAITALSEINLLRPGKVKILVKNNLENVLAALGETSKWGQVCMLDYLAENPPKESKNAET